MNTWLWEKRLITLKPKALSYFLAYASQLNISAFDFSQTIAWSAGQGSIILNDDRFDGVVQDRSALAAILDELNSEVDPRTGQPPFASIHHREDVWSGPYLKDMPDLIALPNSRAGYFIHWVMMPARRYAIFKNGEHSMDGFYLVSEGSGQQERNILQIAPTVLKLMDMKIPDNIDICLLYTSPSPRD